MKYNFSVTSQNKVQQNSSINPNKKSWSCGACHGTCVAYDKLLFKIFVAISKKYSNHLLKFFFINFETV